MEVSIKRVQVFVSDDDNNVVVKVGAVVVIAVTSIVVVVTVSIYAHYVLVCKSCRSRCGAARNFVLCT